MSLVDFSYHRPASLQEACALGARLGADAAYLAGGTELLPDYQRQRETARHLIALDGIQELRRIAMDGDVLVIGGLATIADVAASPLVRARFRALADAAATIGSPPIRSRATIGGNFCRAVPCADTPPAAIVAGATVRLTGPSEARELDAEAFFTGPRQTALRPGEVLTAVLVPAQPSGSGASYQRFARRQGSALAVASVAARLVVQDGVIRDARIALGAVAPVPMLARRAMAVLAGEAPTADLFALAGALCADEALPISDLRGSADFRRELVAVLARRALAGALPAGGGR